MYACMFIQIDIHINRSNNFIILDIIINYCGVGSRPSNVKLEVKCNHDTTWQSILKEL